MLLLIAFLTGLAVVGLVLVIVVFKLPNPSSSQFAVLRTLLAIGAGAIASGLTGFLEVEIPNVAKGGGGLAVFALVYLKAPAGWNLVKSLTAPQRNRSIEVGDRVIVRRSGQETVRSAEGLVAWTNEMRKYRGQTGQVVSIETVVGSEKVAKLTLDGGRHEWHLNWLDQIP